VQHAHDQITINIFSTTRCILKNLLSFVKEDEGLLEEGFFDVDFGLVVEFGDFFNEVFWIDEEIPGSLMSLCNS
jgi:hypothetical protein